MKTFNPEKTIQSEFRYLYILIFLTMFVLLISNNSFSTELQLNPWLNGIIQSPVSLSSGWIICLRIIFILVSTILVWLISTKYLEAPRKDYTLFFVVPVIHFCITDWTMGLYAAVYWTSFLATLYLLTPSESARSEHRKTLTAGILGGFILLNGLFGALIFLSGILIMIIWQSISFRQGLIYLIGFMAPGIYVVAYYFLSDQMAVITSNLPGIFPAHELVNSKFPLVYIVSPALLFLLALLVHSRMSENKISMRRSYSAILFALIALFPGVFLSFRDATVLFSILGFSSVYYWSRLIYTARSRVAFVIFASLPVVLPILYHYVFYVPN